MWRLWNGSNNLNKMRLDKCNAYTAKEILGYRGRKTDRDRIRNKSTDKL